VKFTGKIANVTLLVNCHFPGLESHGKSRNQYASPPRQCNTGRLLERFWRKFVLL